MISFSSYMNYLSLKTHQNWRRNINHGMACIISGLSILGLLP